MTFEGISAITLGTHDMVRATAFYESLGFEQAWAARNGTFTVFRCGKGYVNLVLAAPGARWGWWGRVIIYVSDVDALYARALAAGHAPEAPPRDAEWGERYFHVLDPDGHELSFAHPLHRRP